MKVLFLDHDGVICLQSEWGGRFGKEREGLDSVFDDFNESAVKVLNEIIDATDCEIVISSDWRHYATLEQLQELYRIRGIRKQPIAVTETISCSSAFLEAARVQEIESWIHSHPEITSWCAVDDMDLGNAKNPNHEDTIGLVCFVRTPNYDGLRQTGKKEKIIQFLNIK
jgi:HAD domain in Swiss Army Knife RNA repair proteins